VHQAITSGADITELSRQCTSTVLERIVTQGNNDRVVIVPFTKLKKAPSWLNLFDHWRIVAIIKNILSHVLYRYCPRKFLSNIMCGCVVTSYNYYILGICIHFRTSIAINHNILFLQKRGSSTIHIHFDDTISMYRYAHFQQRNYTFDYPMDIHFDDTI
jgi:hypothetical protein